MVLASGELVPGSGCAKARGDIGPTSEQDGSGGREEESEAAPTRSAGWREQPPCLLPDASFPEIRNGRDLSRVGEPVNAKQLAPESAQNWRFMSFIDRESTVKPTHAIAPKLPIPLSARAPSGYPNRMIHVQNLTKYYGDYPAVRDVSFSVPKGQIVGFLGPNGAGKSTTMRILAGYLAATSGSATIDDIDVFWHPVAARRHIGYMPENCPLYPEMRVREYLHFRSGIKGLHGAKHRQRNRLCSRSLLA